MSAAQEAEVGGSPEPEEVKETAVSCDWGIAFYIAWATERGRGGRERKVEGRERDRDSV